MLSFLNRKPKLPPVDLSVLKMDIHSHLLPGIDDGAPTMEHTLEMIRKFRDLGYEKLVFTPHVMTGVYDNNPEIILGKLAEVREAVQEAGIEIELDAAAEYFLDEIFVELVQKKEVLTFAGNHVLFECSFRSESNHIESVIFQLRSGGYQPVIAHFERYAYYHDRIEMAQRFRDLGALIQVNLLSVLGYYGGEIKKQTIRMIKEGYVDLVGSDCHRIEHLLSLESKLNDSSLRELIDMPLMNAKIR